MNDSTATPAPTYEDILRLFQETDRKFQETDRKFQETDRKFQETDRLLKEQGKQIGGLGEKFGSFTEGLALPSMERILQQHFAMEVVSPSVRVRKGGEHIEIDVLSYANSGINEAYVVEVKSHPRQEAIEQLERILSRFRPFFPEHQDKMVYGILAGVDWVAEVRRQALTAGFHVATIHDNLFELQSPEGFKPKAWYPFATISERPTEENKFNVLMERQEMVYFVNRKTPPPCERRGFWFYRTLGILRARGVGRKPWSVPYYFSYYFKRWIICRTSYISNLLLAITSALGKIAEGYAIGSPNPSALPSTWLH